MERLSRRARVDTVEEVGFLVRTVIAAGAWEREMVMEGGGARDEVDADLGSSGRVMDGAGFGEGMLLIESRE